MSSRTGRISRRNALLAGGAAPATLDALPRPAAAQAPPAASPYSFERGYPAGDTARRARDDADFQRAVTAYRFWYATVSMEGIFNDNREAGIQDNQAVTIMAAGPRQVGFTTNSDTPYGAGALDLSVGPMVVEMPPGPFIGLVNDHHQGWVQDMGIPGPDEGRGGKHLVLPPGHSGPVPGGYHVGRSHSLKVLAAIRALPRTATRGGRWRRCGASAFIRSPRPTIRGSSASSM
jgi:hypothetical protein